MSYSKLISILPISFLAVLMSVLGNSHVRSQMTIMWITYFICVLGILFWEKWGKKKVDVENANSTIYIAYIGLLFINMLFSLPIEVLHQLTPFRIVMLMLLAVLSGLLINIAPTTGNVATNLLAVDKETNDTTNQKWPSVFRALRSEHKTYLLGLAAIVLIGFVLRIRHLLNVDSFFDEDEHIFHVINLLETGEFKMKRARFVTYLSALFAWLGNATTYHELVYWCRVPSVIIATLTTIPIYLLGRYISKETAIIAALLWVTSPWALGVARYIREPSYLPLFILLTTLFLLRIIILTLNFKKDNLLKMSLYSLPILSLLYYGFFVDVQSHIKITAVIYAAITLAFVIAYAQELLGYLKKNRFLPYIFIAFIAVFGALMSRSRFLNYSRPNIRWSDTFLNSNIVSPMHWWHHYENDIFLVYVLLLLGVAFAYRYQQKHYLIYTFATLFVIAGYYYFFDRYYQPRYIFYILPFFVLSIAGSLYFIFKSLNDIHSDKIRLSLKALMILFIVIIFNPQNTLISSTAPGYGLQYATISTDTKHDDKTVVLDFFNKKSKQELEDLKRAGIITTGYVTILKHDFEIPLENFLSYNHSNKDRFEHAEIFMNQYEEGYMLLDHHRNGIWSRGFPLDTLPFRLGDCEVQLIQNEKRCHIYKWKHTNYTATSKDFVAHTMKAKTRNKPLFQVLETSQFLAKKTNTKNAETNDSLTTIDDPNIAPDTVLIDLTQPISIAFWAKLNGEKNNRYQPFDLGHHQENGISMLFNHPKAMDKLAIIYESEGDCRAAKTPKLNRQNWHQIIWYHEGNCEGATFGIYFDGKKMGECVIPKAKNLKIPLQINTEESSVDIKALTIFDEALSIEQAQKLYEATNFEPQNLPNATEYVAISTNMLNANENIQEMLLEDNNSINTKIEADQKTMVDMSKANSISFWLKTDSLDAGAPFSIGEKNDQIGLLVDFLEKEEELSFRYKPLQQHNDVIQSNAVNDGEWHHIIWFQYGGAVNAPYGLFVDGDLGQYSKVPVQQSANLPIVLNKEFKGKIADVKVFPYVVKRLEVYKIFSKGGDTTKVNQIRKIEGVGFL